MKRIFVDLLQSKKPVWRVLRIIGAVLVLGVALLMIFENKLIFFPHEHRVGEGSMTPPPPWKLTATRAAQAETVTFSPADKPNLVLHAWYYTLHEDGKPIENDYVVIYCHGNAGDVPRRHQKSALICGVGVDVLAFDYRGYGANKGSPSESGVYADGQAAYDFLIARGIAAERIIIYGESLGGAVAVELASRVSCAGLILESTFTSVPDMGRVAYPFVPMFLVRTKMDSLKKMPSVACPKYFMHGKLDSVVPTRMSDELYAAANEPKRQWIFPDADHDDVFAQDDYADVWAEFLEFVNNPNANGQPE